MYLVLEVSERLNLDIFLLKEKIDVEIAIRKHEGKYYPFTSKIKDKLICIDEAHQFFNFCISFRCSICNLKQEIFEKLKRQYS